MYCYFAQFYPEDDGGYSVYFPDLPGCLTCGDNLNEARLMAVDALTGHLEAMIEDGDAIPNPSDYETAKAKAIEAYREMDIPERSDALYLLVEADPEAGDAENISTRPRQLETS